MSDCSSFNECNKISEISSLHTFAILKWYRTWFSLSLYTDSKPIGFNLLLMSLVVLLHKLMDNGGMATWCRYGGVVTEHMLLGGCQTCSKSVSERVLFGIYRVRAPFNKLLNKNLFDFERHTLSIENNVAMLKLKTEVHVYTFYRS